MKYDISASIMCADPLCMRPQLLALRDNGVAYLHCDVMDGHFVPNVMLSTETVNAVKRERILPIDLHLMVTEPENRLSWFDFGQDDLVSIHIEASKDVQKALTTILNRGAVPSLAINPDTPLERVRPYLPQLGMLLVMTVTPGFAGQVMSQDALRKITKARQMLDESGYPPIRLEVDGNCSFANAPAMRAAGADRFVVGSSSVFHPSLSIPEGVRRFHQGMENA